MRKIEVLGAAFSIWSENQGENTKDLSFCAERTSVLYSESKGQGEQFMEFSVSQKHMH